MAPNRSAVVVRRLEREDLAAALDIQSENYPAFLVEDEQAFASRLDVDDPYCLAATRDDQLVGYLLAHGWPSQSPPEPGIRLVQSTPSEVLYIHDLGVSSAARGLGIGRTMVARAFEMARRNGLRTAELVAVEGAARYWRTLGFKAAPAPAPLLGKLAAYGSDACWMSRMIGSELRGGDELD